MGLVPILALLLALAAPALAQTEGCECLWQGPFVEVQEATDLVVSGSVSQVRGNAVDLSVERVLRGQPSQSEIRIWMKTADYCRPEVERFPVGSEWVMALSRIDEQVPGGFNPNTPNFSYGRVGDYALSACGGYFLSRRGDLVTGNLVEGARWDYEPKMNPILLDLVAGFVAGELDSEALKKASEEDPALREMMLDTKAFLRGDDEYLDEEP